MAPGDNMESLLMGGDDSSSGESDSEVAVAKAPAPPPAAAAPAPAPPPPPAPAATSKSMSSAEMSMRLKSMYSPANKGGSSGKPPVPTQQLPPAAAPPVPKPAMQPQTSSGPPPRSHHGRMPPQQAHRGMPPPHGSHPSLPPPGVPSRSVSSRTSNDPYEPTPVAKIIERQSHKARVPQAAMPPGATQMRMNYKPIGSSSSSGGAPATMDRAAKEREMKKQKEKFLIFTRVLLKYLEQKDPDLHKNVKAIIKDCAERNKRQERGYESVTASMRQRLKEVVNDSYWKRAEAYLHHFLQQKTKNPGAAGGGSGMPGMLPSSGHPQSQEARKKAVEMQRRQQQMQQQARQQSQPPPSSSRPPSTSSSSNHPSTMRPESSSSSSTSKRPAPAPAPSSSYKPSSSSAPSSTQAKSSASQSYASKGKQAAKSRGKSVASTSPTGLQRSSTTSGKVDTSKEAQPVREYSAFMEMVDHAIEFDWTTAGLMSGQKVHAHLSEEQRNLLYSSDSTKKPSAPRGGAPLSGWGRHNVVSARTAWARVRLPEQENGGGAPRVGNGVLSLPGGPTARGSGAAPTTHAAWQNEDVAEQDLALTAISQGAQLYLRSILEKAIHCNRQRQNLDGIRLWSQQFTSSGSKPALTLRLGCDVSRQTARAAGNAAMTCKRMEEALERHEDVVPDRERVLNDETLANATTMSDLALRPKLANGVKDADYHAKKQFEILGGKEAGDPPFGRVPKRAKLELQDFVMGMNFVGNGSNHRAQTLSGSFAF